MLRRAEPPDPAEPHPPGARARVAAMRRDGPDDDGPGSAPVYDAASWPGEDPRPRVGDGLGERARGTGDDVPLDVSDGDANNDADDGLPDVPAQAPGWVPDRGARAARPARAWAARLTTAGPWGELAEKWVPESLRGARVDPKRRGALLLSAVAAIAAVIAALGVWWSRPQPTPVLAGPSAAASTGSGAGAAPLGDNPDGAGASAGSLGTTQRSLGATQGVAAQPDAGPAGSGQTAAGQAAGPVSNPGRTEPADAAGTIVVSVTGNVRHPGVVTVPVEARVADAVAAAGGALDDSDLTGLNLAARLTDGSSVVVAGGGGSAVTRDSASSNGTAGGATGSNAGSSVGSTAGGGATDAKVSLNTADATTLQSLSGVGPVTAAAIIAYRTEHGPFTDLAQLQEVSGIGPATFARLEPHVTL